MSFHDLESKSIGLMILQELQMMHNVLLRMERKFDCVNNDHYEARTNSCSLVSKIDQTSTDDLPAAKNDCEIPVVNRMTETERLAGNDIESSCDNLSSEKVDKVEIEVNDDYQSGVEPVILKIENDENIALPDFSDQVCSNVDVFSENITVQESQTLNHFVHDNLFKPCNNFNEDSSYAGTNQEYHNTSQESEISNHFENHSLLKPSSDSNKHSLNDNTSESEIPSDQIKTAKSISSLTNSKNSNHSWICNICSKVYSCKSSLNRHMETHIPTKKFQCMICFGRFTRSFHLKNHMVTAHSMEATTSDIDEQNCQYSRLKCEVCSKFFSSRASLQRHLLFHTGNKKFACPLCSESFVRKDYLKFHIMRKCSKNKWR